MGFVNFGKEPEVVEMDTSDDDDGPDVVEIVTIDSEEEKEEDEKESAYVRKMIEKWTQEKIEKAKRAAEEVIDLTLDDDDEDVPVEESSSADGNADSEPQCPQAMEGDESSADVNGDPQGPQAMDEEGDDNGDADTVVIEEVMPNPAEEEAEDFKRRGNEHFKNKNYPLALEMYTKAIETLPSKASFYGNRSACYMMMQRYKDALDDIKLSLNIDRGYDKSYLRWIRATLALGNVRECEQAFESGEKVGIKKQEDAAFKHEFERLQKLKRNMLEIESAREQKKDYHQLYPFINKALEVASANPDLKVMKADALVRLGRIDEARKASNEVLESDKMSVEARYFEAVCFYLEDSMEKSIEFLRQALRLLRDAPDNNPCRILMKFLKHVKDLREIGRVKFNSNRLEEAKKEYEQCLKVVQEGEFQNKMIESKLYCNLALIAFRKNQLDDSMILANKAVELNPSYGRAYLHRSKIYKEKEMFEEEVRDLKEALKIHPSDQELVEKLREAEKAAKKPKSYYSILNVRRNATEDEIRKAYKKRALVHHPDRHSSATKEEQKVQEELFKKMKEAFETLTDPRKRLVYDQTSGSGVSSSGSGSSRKRCY